jgi:hypothetical protein
VENDCDRWGSVAGGGRSCLVAWSTQITHDGLPKEFHGQVGSIVLTEGPRLFVQESVGGRFVVAQVSASGGETVPIQTPFQNVALDNISSDKSELLIGTFTGIQMDQPLWALPILGGSPRRLGNLIATDGAPGGMITTEALGLQKCNANTPLSVG